MSRNYKIAVLPGDGTGPEVVAEGLKVMRAAAKKFGFDFTETTFNWGGEHYLATGEILPEDAVDQLKKFDAVFLGAIGHPKVKPGILEKGILLKLRFELDQYISFDEFKSVLCKNTDDEKKIERIYYLYVNLSNRPTAHTLEQVGGLLNVTRERIRQVEAKGLKKLRRRTMKNGYSWD